MSQATITPEIVKMELKELLQRLGMETELKEKRIVDLRKSYSGEHKKLIK